MKKTLKRLALIAMAVVMAATSSLCLGAEDTAVVETPETFETEYTTLQYLSEAYRIMDEDVKSGRISDRLGVELLIVRYGSAPLE